MLERGVSSLRRAARLTGLSRSTVFHSLRPDPIRRPRADVPTMRAAIRWVALTNP